MIVLMYNNEKYMSIKLEYISRELEIFKCKIYHKIIDIVCNAYYNVNIRNEE